MSYKYLMKRRLLIVFFISTTFFTAVLTLAGQWMHQQQLHSQDMETNLLHQTVEEAIRENFTIIRSISTIAANYFDTEEIDQRRYRKMGESLLTVYPEMLGLNILDVNGHIIRVHPHEENKLALGKQSQNYQTLYDRLQLGEKFWLSPPFQLYQGDPGFVFYRAIGEGSHFKGWVALVVSYQRFFSRFRMTKYLSRYHLVIKDLETNRNFYTTTPLENLHGRIWKKESDFFGRKVAFYSTPRKIPVEYKKSLIFCFAVSVLLSGLTVYAYKQRISYRESKRKLSHVNALLSLSTGEASQVLKNINSELTTNKEPEAMKEKVAGYVFYMEDLLQQLTVTNSLTRPNMSSELLPLDVFPMLTEQVNFFDEILKTKGLVIEITGLQGQYLMPAHRWLLCHSGFGNILRYLIHIAKGRSHLRVIYALLDGRSLISFHADIEESKLENDPMVEILQRGLSIAQEIFSLHQISMTLIERDAEKIVTLALPPQSK